MPAYNQIGDYRQFVTPSIDINFDTETELTVYTSRFRHADELSKFLKILANTFKNEGVRPQTITNQEELIVAEVK